MEVLALVTSLAVVAAFGALGVGTAGVLVWAQHQRRAQLEDRAHRLGLEVRRDGSLRGTWRGHQVWVFAHDNAEGGWHTEVAVRLSVPIGPGATAGSGKYAPSDGRAYAALPHLVFRGDEAVAHALVRHPAFVTAAAACPELEIGDIVRVRTEHDAETGLERAIQVAEAIGEALLAPWHAFAETNGLDLRDASRIEGTIGHRPVLIESTGAQTIIAVGVHPPLEGSIAHGKGVRLGDPVLDGHVAVDEAVVDRLGPVDDALRAALMEVFHQHPKSRADGSWITVRIEGRVVDRLDEPLSAAWTLAKRLDS